MNNLPRDLAGTADIELEAEQWQAFFFVQDDFRVTPDLTLNLGLRYEISGCRSACSGPTDPQSLVALMPGPVEMDRNNWAPRAGFAWNPKSTTGSSATTVGLRGGFGMGYDVIFYNLLVVNASNYPRLRDARRHEPAAISSRTDYRGAHRRCSIRCSTYTNSAGRHREPGERFYSLTFQREFGRYMFEVGYSGSRGYKGINQIEMNPAILTAEQAAAVARRRARR